MRRGTVTSTPHQPAESRYAVTAPYRYPQAPQPRTAYPPSPYQQVPYQQVPYQQVPYAPGPYPPGPGFPYAPAPRSSRPEPWVIALIAIVAVALLGAVALAAGTTTGTSTAQPGQPGQPGQQGGTNCPGGSLEGCYTEGQMQAFLGVAVRFVHGFSDDRYTRMPHPAGYQLIGSGRGAQSPCGTLDSMTYAYCPADDRVYIGQKQLWLFYSGIGDAAAVVGLAHEYGHHVQRVAGVPDLNSPSARVRHENQADCIAGAFVGWARDQGFLEDGDTQDIAGLVKAIASSEDDPGRDHGTLAERAASMSTGIRDGLPGCSAFYPETPVHQA